jgi:branched-chain amino acid transport system substrate-binding protein
MRPIWLAAALAVSTSTGSAPAGAEAVLGLPSSLSGPELDTGRERGVEIAVRDLNAAGGLLGQEIRIVKLDDQCDAEIAVAVAHKLVAEQVDFVVGHVCSDAAVPASQVYADAGIPMMTDAASNSQLTERGLWNIFRICGRDDVQGAMAGRYLADQWGHRKIAILHDGGMYGKGLAEQARKALNERGVTEVLFAQVDRDAADDTDVLNSIQAAQADVLYYAGFSQKGALLIEQLRERGDDLQFVTGDSGLSEAYALIAGDAGNGMLFTADAPKPEQATALLDAFHAEGREPDPRVFLTYAVVQAWAQAVEQAGSLDGDAVSDALHTGEFDTVIGKIGFDDKGDVTGVELFGWYRWQDGKASPVNLSN